MSLEFIGWLFTIGVLILNTEEALWLPAWSEHSGKWHPAVGQREFRFAVIVLSVLLVIFCLSSSLNPAGSISAYLMAGYVLAMVLNDFRMFSPRYSCVVICLVPLLHLSSICRLGFSI